VTLMRSFACGPAVGLLLLLLPLDVHAQQCGAALSQCRDCHEVRGLKPVEGGGASWHRDHAFGDFCAACHGGDPAAPDRIAAHAGLRSPMRNVQQTCGVCHAADAPSLAQRYARGTETVSPLIPGPREPPAPHRSPWANLLLAGIVLGLGGVGAAYVVNNERRIRSEKPRGDVP
jgi:hypothetical protein